MLEVMRKIETRDVLALSSLATFVGLVVLYIFHPPADPTQGQVISGFIGMIGGTCLGGSFSYYFGTTQNRTDEAKKADGVIIPNAVVPPGGSLARAAAAPLALALLFTLATLPPVLAQDSGQLRGRAATPAPKLNLPIDPLGLNNKNASGDPAQDLLNALEVKLLPDLKFALNVATSSGDDLTAPCWSAWIKLIEDRQKANVDAQGNPMPEPDPALITKFQKLVNIRNALQPTSPFMRACSPVAEMVKADIRKFIGLIMTGGAGLAALGIGL